MYYLPKKSKISLTIYDALGREIRSLDKGQKDYGYHTLEWDSKDNYGNKVGAGIYLYQLLTEGYIKNNKMVLIK
jgi:flagellar hook assembly protein FlgD